MKPKDPIKHHYVPKVYLKRFENKAKRLYQLCKVYKGITQKYSSQICYEKDYFKFKRNESKILQGLKDDYYIEKKAFTQQENNFTQLADLVSQKKKDSFEVPRHCVETLLSTLVTIKRRNPSMRNHMISALQKEVTLENLRKRFKAYEALARNIDKIAPIIYFKKTASEFNNEPSKAEDLYISSFIDKRSQIVKNVTDTFLQSSIQIYHAPVDHEFLTSDNPGFVLSGTDIINFGGLGSSFLFAFPLSPTVCLIIDSDQKSRESNEAIWVSPQVCEPSQVDFINISTSVMANKHLYAQNAKTLELLKKLGISNSLNCRLYLTNKEIKRH